jgi:hypothetical protein
MKERKLRSSVNCQKVLKQKVIKQAGIKQGLVILYRFRLDIFAQILETSIFTLKGKYAVCRNITNILPIFGYFKYWLVNGDMIDIRSTLRAEESGVRIPAATRGFPLL